jgi:hypothetical protein
MLPLSRRQSPSVNRWVALLAAGIFTHAHADTALSGSITAATENVGRGISYSREEPSLSTQFLFQRSTIELAGSAINVSAGPASVELSLQGRWVLSARGVDYRMSLEKTWYPRAVPNADYHEWGLTAHKETVSGALDLALRHSPDDSGGAQYGYADLTRKLTDWRGTRLALKARIGWRTYDDNRQAGQPDYLHGSLGLVATRSQWSADLTYHATDLPAATFFPSNPRVVARVTYLFEPKLIAASPDP